MSLFKVLELLSLKQTKCRRGHERLSMPVLQLRLTLACTILLVVRSKVHSHTLDLLWQYVDAFEARVKKVSCTHVQ
jgi:hypothetical protein